MATTLDSRLVTANTRDGVDTRKQELTTRLVGSDQEQDGQTAVGYVYCMSNPLYDGILKVGITERTPEERAKELYSTGVPLPFKVEFAKKVANPREKEILLHKLLEQYTERISSRREFFRVGVEEVRTFFGLMDGEWWSNMVEESEDEEDENKDEESNTKKRSAPGCRDMTKCFTDGQKIRHVIGINKVRIGVYDSSKNGIVYDEIVYGSLSSFALAHAREYTPTRCSVNGWEFCECEIDGKWVSTYSLPG